MKKSATFTIYYVGTTSDGATGENCCTVRGWYNGSISQTMRRAFHQIACASGMLWGINGVMVESIEVEE